MVERKSNPGFWDEVYSRDEMRLSWHQDDPAISMRLLRRVAPARTARVIDVGGGASALAGLLVQEGFPSPTVLDISEAAIAQGRARLGSLSTQVNWLVADVTAAPSLGAFEVWHDRAVFHFLTEVRQRRAYRGLALQSVPPGGHVIIATFSAEGPERCSGLPVRRYDANLLVAELGPEFRLESEEREQHRTPDGVEQDFLYCVFKRSGPPA